LAITIVIVVFNANVVEKNDRTEIDEARTSNHGDIFEAALSRDAAQRKLIDDLLALFGGRTQPVMAHLIESGKLTLNDVKEAGKILRKLARKDKSK
jgi:predicted transcriptional regulator